MSERFDYVLLIPDPGKHYEKVGEDEAGEPKYELAPDKPPHVTRPDGFYWLKWGRTWTIGQWEQDDSDRADGYTKCWTVPGDELTHNESDFDEIGPRLEPPA